MAGIAPRTTAFHVPQYEFPSGFVLSRDSHIAEKQERMQFEYDAIRDRLIKYLNAFGAIQFFMDMEPTLRRAKKQLELQYEKIVGELESIIGGGGLPPPPVNLVDKEVAKILNVRPMLEAAGVPPPPAQPASPAPPRRIPRLPTFPAFRTPPRNDPIRVRPPIGVVQALVALLKLPPIPGPSRPISPIQGLGTPLQTRKRLHQEDEDDYHTIQRSRAMARPEVEAARGCGRVRQSYATRSRRR